jgi:hypothetical protein
MGNLTVFGTQSVQYITSSQLNVANNIINVNVGTPGVRFGGLSVYDSGSQAGATGSLFWDSQNNNWVYQQVTGSTYTGGMLISGPRNTGGLGNEQGTTSGSLMKGQGGDHMTSSAIFEDGYKATVYTNALVVSSSGLVGIGTTNPSARLDVQGGSDGDQMISIGSNSISGVLSSPANIYINADSNNDDANGQIQLGFNRTGFTGGIPVITIKETNAYATGSVGIGTTSTTWSSGGTTYAPVLNVDGGYNNVAYFKTNASGSTAVTINSPVYFLAEILLDLEFLI